MKYCEHCGNELILKNIEKEGQIPYCSFCDKLYFPLFNTAVSMIALNPRKDKILLIKQYGKERNILVAGYVNKTENVEETLCREMKEEIGRKVVSYRYMKSSYYEKTNTLMLNFAVVLDSEVLDIDQEEVDEACWYSFEEAKKHIAQDSLAQEFLLNFLDKIIKEEDFTPLV